MPMPSIHAPKSGRNTTLRDMMKSYLPSAEKTGEEAHAGVKFIRNLARHVLDANRDIADTEFDADQEPNVGRDLFDFMMNEFAEALNQAEREARAKRREVTEADLVKLIPDNTERLLAERIRERIYDAVTSSTTDSI